MQSSSQLNCHGGRKVFNKPLNPQTTSHSASLHQANIFAFSSPISHLHYTINMRWLLIASASAATIAAAQELITGKEVVADSSLAEKYGLAGVTCSFEESKHGTYCQVPDEQEDNSRMTTYVLGLGPADDYEVDESAELEGGKRDTCKRYCETSNASPDFGDAYIGNREFQEKKGHKQCCVNNLGGSYCNRTWTYGSASGGICSMSKRRLPCVECQAVSAATGALLTRIGRSCSKNGKVGGRIDHCPIKDMRIILYHS